ncbi:MAG: hypothetical protein K9I29_06960 [Bacteroidales bacterium]|nr:hypothetical protein [Bacteroidales bacterium]
MSDISIEKAINEYLKKAQPYDRYTSFDYCYNYFQRTKDLTQDVEKSCLVIGFYLASWGMYRGSSFILQKSIKHFQPLIEYLSTIDTSVWDIDVNSYTEENKDTIINIYNEIKTILIPKQKNDLTLTTKILLGIFGFIPAYDNFFCNTFRSLYKGQCGFRRVNMNSLSCIQDFYENHKSTIDKFSNETFTTAFLTGKKTTIHYPKAKIIDMYGFVGGIIHA